MWVPAFSVGPQLKFYLPCSINIFVLTCDVASLILISERKMIGQYRLHFHHLQVVKNIIILVKFNPFDFSFFGRIGGVTCGD